jgi:NhaP-type Na+/H+ or K+/H+ antiporter
MSIEEVGALCFGVVVGWIVYRTLRRTTDKAGVSDLATVIGAIGGAAVTTHFHSDRLFGFYSIGLAAGFFVYLVLGHTLFKNSLWLGGGE